MSGRIHPRRRAVAQRLRLFFAAVTEELRDGANGIWERVEARLRNPYPNPEQESKDQPALRRDAR
jgi:hypothetical protein